MKKQIQQLTYFITLLVFALVMSALVMSAKALAVEPLLRFNVDKNSTVPGTPVVLTLVVLSPTWLPKAPVMPSFEIPNVVVNQPPNSSGSAGAKVNGKTWSGIRKEYYIYPMLPQTIILPPLPVEVTYADPETSQPKTLTLFTPEIEITAEMPEGAEQMDPFFATYDFSVEQEVEGELTGLTEGDIITRTLVAKSAGTSAMFIPELSQDWSVEGVGVYPKEAVLTEKEIDGNRVGLREVSITYIAQKKGSFTLPAIEIQWYNLNDQEVQQEIIPAMQVTVTKQAPALFNKEKLLSLGISLLGIFIFIFAVYRPIYRFIKPRVIAYRQQQKEQYLNSEKYAYQRVVTALSAQQLGESLQCLKTWQAKALTRQDQGLELVYDSLVKIGESLYSNNSTDEVNNLWVMALNQFNKTRNLWQANKKTKQQKLTPLNPYRQR